MPRKAEPAQEWSDLDRLLTLVHDMRTPLATISASSEMLEHLVLDGEASILLKVIDRQVCRLDTMLKELSQLTGLAPDEPTASENEPMELVAFVDGLMTEFRVLNPAYRFVFEPAVPQLWAVVAEAHLRRILQNLLNNAVAYSPHKTSICVRVKQGGRDGEEAVIEVEDEGPGVPEASRSDIFNPFVRKATSPANGNGLGLYIVRCLVAAHGGQARVESGAVGALFKVSLPLYKASFPAIPAPNKLPLR